MNAYNKLIKENFCGFCGKYEKCSGKRHTKTHLRDLLVDAGIIEDTEKAFTEWWFDKANYKNDPDNFLLGHPINVVWPIYSKRVAYYIRSVL